MIIRRVCFEEPLKSGCLCVAGTGFVSGILHRNIYMPSQAANPVMALPFQAVLRHIVPM